MKRNEFLESLAGTIRSAAALSAKARSEGLLALEDELEGIDDAFMKLGLRLMIDGTDAEILDEILSIRIGMENDDDVRLLKTMQKEAVLSIQRGENTKILTMRLIFHVGDSELAALRETFPSKDIFKEDIFEGVVELDDQDGKGFAERLAYAVRKAFEFSEKAGKEDLLALEDDLENLEDGFIKTGLRLVVDGTSADIIDELLSLRIGSLRDEDAKRLRTIQKEALLGIQAGSPSAMVLHTMISRIDNSELRALRQALSGTDVFKDFPWGGLDPANDEEHGFARRAADIIRRACRFKEKSEREGLSALGKEIDEAGKERRDVFELGVRLAADGVECETINRLLSNMLDMERDENARILKAMQAMAVFAVCFGQAENVTAFSHRALSLVGNPELAEVQGLLSDMPDILKGICYGGEVPEEYDLTKESKFAEYAARIIRRAWDFYGKARRESALKSQSEGILALEGDIDLEGIRCRDVFEYGIRLAVDGIDPANIDLILSNLVDRERNEVAKRLKTMQREAVSGIAKGENPRLAFYRMSSCLNDGELEKAKGLLADAGIIAGFEEPAKEPPGGRNLQVRPFDLIRVMDPMLLLEFIKREYPQTIATVLSHLDPGRAAVVLQNLPETAQSDVARRIAVNIDRAGTEVYREVERVLERNLASMSAEEHVLPDGLKHACEILNLVDPWYGKRIVKALEGEDPELADEINTRMFLFEFEDIVLLSDRDIQKLLREVDSAELCRALKGMNSEVRETIFRNMSKRAATMIMEDIEYMGPIKLEEVKEARLKIGSIVRHLKDTGEIFIPSSGNDCEMVE